MKSAIKRGVLLGLAGAAILTVGIKTTQKAMSSDHADTPAIAAQPGLDLTDVFVFPSPTNPNNVILAMDVSPLIPTGQAASRSFDPNVLYQFKIDNTGDAVEDLVIQARFTGTGATQKVVITGPVAPTMKGTNSLSMPSALAVGTVNQVFSPTAGMQVFAGPREDPFFFDLEQFFTILPDRETPLNGQALSVADADKPQATSFRPPATAKDFLAGYNVLSIVVELPRSQLIGTGNGKIGVWCTTSK